MPLLIEEYYIGQVDRIRLPHIVKYSISCAGLHRRAPE